MPEFCTCGARPPEDALFCHKCGRPLREPAGGAAAAEVAGPDPAAMPAVSAPAPVDIGFHNATAVRAGLLAAGLGFCISLAVSVAGMLAGAPMPLQLLLQLGALLLVGGYAVHLYRRRTGQRLSPRGGARVGWIAGVFCFVLATLFFTFSVVSITSKGGLANVFREQVKGSAAGTPEVEQALRILDSPTGLATLILLYLLVLFVLFTLLPALGGALGAKLLERDSR